MEMTNNIMDFENEVVTNNVRNDIFGDDLPQEEEEEKEETKVIAN